MTPKTKIVCTIGPASRDPHIIENLIREGMQVARLNFSHGTHAEHLETLQQIRAVSDRLHRPVAVLQDLCGPKIRVGVLPESGILLAPGQTIVLTSEAELNGMDTRISVSYPSLADDVKPMDRILLSDGTMEIQVERIEGRDVFCKVVTGGRLTSHKGINLVTGTLNAPSLTEKDRKDLAFGLTHGVDFVALSFVRSPKDILDAKEAIRQTGKSTPVIAKIEKHEALSVIDSIIEVSDGIMVARGDLGVEIPLESVPHIQKKLVKKARSAGKPVIIATQMLRSMVDSPRPTRAEASDVANAVLDGTDAVMLSEETASGNYPVEAVRYMAKIVSNAEMHYLYHGVLDSEPEQEISESVAHASCSIAAHLGAVAIVTPTRSGLTAMQVARYRPKQPILALSPVLENVRKLCLVWGCMPVWVPDATAEDEPVQKASRVILDAGLGKPGDLMVFTAGYPVWVSGLTNMLHVKRL
ncbi:MAG: pyruvate kinase [Thermodesulfobacteriota bacterium]